MPRGTGAAIKASQHQMLTGSAATLAQPPSRLMAINSPVESKRDSDGSNPPAKIRAPAGPAGGLSEYGYVYITDPGDYKVTFSISGVQPNQFTVLERCPDYRSYLRRGRRHTAKRRASHRHSGNGRCHHNSKLHFRGGGGPPDSGWRDTNQRKRFRCNRGIKLRRRN